MRGVGGRCQVGMGWDSWMDLLNADVGWAVCQYRSTSILFLARRKRTCSPVSYFAFTVNFNEIYQVSPIFYTTADLHATYIHWNVQLATHERGTVVTGVLEYP